MNDKSPRSFSQRIGMSPESVPQLSGMNEPLRRAVWNAIHRSVFSSWRFTPKTTDGEVDQSWHRRMFIRIWGGVLDNFEDEAKDSPQWCTSEIKDAVLTKPWNSVYDIVEAIARYDGCPVDFEATLNSALEDGGSAYRLTSGIVTEITDTVERNEITRAAQGGVEDQCSTWIDLALQRLTPMPRGDYAGSINASIQAVVVMAGIVAAKPDATLADAMKTIRDRYGLPKALLSSYEQLYAFTIGYEGTNGVFGDSKHATPELARYFLVTCSAFVNYLKAVDQQMQNPDHP